MNWPGSPEGSDACEEVRDRAIRLAMARTAPTVIQALAGNEHLTTTMRYRHVVPGVTAEAIKTVDRPLPTGIAS